MVDRYGFQIKLDCMIVCAGNRSPIDAKVIGFTTDKVMIEIDNGDYKVSDLVHPDEVIVTNNIGGCSYDLRA